MQLVHSHAVNESPCFPAGRRLPSLPGCLTFRFLLRLTFCYFFLSLFLGCLLLPFLFRFLLSLFLGYFLFGLLLCFLFRFLLGYFLLRLLLRYFLLSLSLGSFFLRLSLSGSFLLRYAFFLWCCFLLSGNFPLRSFLPSLLLCSHCLSPCRVPGVEYIQQYLKIQQQA